MNIGFFCFFLRAYLNLVCLFNETFCCCKLKKTKKAEMGPRFNAYICGVSEMVLFLKKWVFLKGVFGFKNH